MNKIDGKSFELDMLTQELSYINAHGGRNPTARNDIRQRIASIMTDRRQNRESSVPEHLERRGK